jgi:coenzyme F420 hydrogenase subunit beta
LSAFNWTNKKKITMTAKENNNQQQLVSSVIDSGLCAGCGACVGLCPYMRNEKTDTVALFKCDLDDGRCYRYCPRTPTQLDELQKGMFSAAHLTEEVGAFQGLYMTRALDPEIREKAQHGGTVSALLSLALAEGMIDACVITGQDDKMLPKSLTAKTKAEILAAAGSKFANAPTVAEFNRASVEGDDRLGVVATPCQALALAKMKANPAEKDAARMGRLKLVIGLFCGWTLDWRKLRSLVAEAVGGDEILALDIPPSKHACMQVTTSKGITEIPIDQVDTCVRNNCDYCGDMTAEFSDLSVGSARSKEGWEVDKGWNQVIVRSAAGEKLLNLAREKNILEFKEVPEQNITKLKAAALNKKKNGTEALAKLENSSIHQ